MSVRVTAAIATAVLLASCDGETPTDRCEKVPARLRAAIAGDEIEPVGAAAVKSDDFEQVYMIAISFTAAGVKDPEVGVWATNSLRPGGTVLAVDGFAREFTDWPDSDARDITQTDDGVAEAKACLNH